MDEEFTLAFNLTLEGETETVGAVPFVNVIVADNAIVPVNPPMLVRIRFERAVVPGLMKRRSGMGLTVKSRG